MPRYLFTKEEWNERHHESIAEKIPEDEVIVAIHGHSDGRCEIYTEKKTDLEDEDDEIEAIMDDSARDIIADIEDGAYTGETLETMKKYEKKHKNRKTVIEAINSALEE